jgi:Na+-transporting NADH:ubiquinone oxidoreductase subunit C
MRNLNSTKYIVGFCTVVCLVCSIFVAGAAVLLKDKQEANAVLDRQTKILVVAGILAEDAKVKPAEVDRLYTTHIRGRVVDLATGEVDAKADPASFDMVAILADDATSIAATPEEIGITGLTRLPKKALVFEVTFGESVEMVVLPIQGKGLWSTLYGYLAIDSNGNTIRGITFYKHGETPGLGGEVDNPSWKAVWSGRKAYNEKGEPAIEVIKGKAPGAAVAPNKVDGLSGSTITSNGVTKFTRFWLGAKAYGPFLARLQKGVKS